MTTHGIDGCLEGVVGFDICGWAWRPAASEEAVSIVVKQGNRVLVTVSAQQFRADLEVASKRAGLCSFRIPISTLELGGKGAELEILAGGSRLGEPIVLDANLVVAAEVYASRLPPGENPATDPAELSHAALSRIPVRFSQGAGIDGWLERFDENGVVGWAVRLDGSAKPIVLSIVGGQREFARFEATSWRLDVAEMRQGDGRAGIDTPPPPRLLDGVRREVDIREASSGLSVLEQPLVVELPPIKSDQMISKRTDKKGVLPRRHLRETRRLRNLLPSHVQLSIIVNFYNMHREAARTLTSLSRYYQLDADDLSYEVICIDNGSKIPMDEAWIAGFGPEFRLFRPSKLAPSPCFALNEAARSAKGKYLALMIDGAHVVTPGVFREVMAALAEEPKSVVGLRQWFVGGDQRWLSAVGYSRETEDIAFARIGWPKHGYRLFEISTPMMPSPNSWFDSASESNFLVLPASVFGEIKGYDERFETPGGSLANLDLFSRAVKRVGGTATMIIGEASFHQYHGGTTTNTDDASKDAAVRGYLNTFYAERGSLLEHVAEDKLRYRGRMPKPVPIAVRQRPIFPAFVGVTSKIRPADRFQHFGEGAEDYLRGYLVEAGIPARTTWFGLAVGVTAGDLLSIQELVRTIRPTRVVAANLKEGLLAYLAFVLDEIKVQSPRLICVGDGALPQRPGMDIVGVPGPAASPQALRAVRSGIGAAEDVLVVFHPDEGDNIPIDGLNAYMKFVSMRSYLVFTGTAFGQPWLGYSTRWYRKAIQVVTSGDSEFRVDPAFEHHLVTACPSGYLRRVGKRLDELSYDASLDDLETL